MGDFPDYLIRSFLIKKSKNHLVIRNIFMGSKNETNEECGNKNHWIESIKGGCDETVSR